MRIGNRQKLFLPSIDPTDTGIGLAFRAMPVEARVIGVAAIFAVRAFITMITEISSATAPDGFHHFQMQPRNPIAIVFDELFPDGAGYIGHFERWPLHLNVGFDFSAGKHQSVKRTDGCA
jgi:hypothetical protein